MPRRARAYLPGYVYHVYQRGNNRAPCFIEPKNYQLYLQLWEELSIKYGVSVHAYCLMTNHIHFLVTPSCKTGLSNTMKFVGSRYAQSINRQYKLTGTLWEGRHRSSLVQTSRYFFTCMRYIELNPVRASIVDRPEQYLWSSYGANAFGNYSWLTTHAEYLDLGKTKAERLLAYQNLFQSQMNQNDLELIRKAAHYGQPIGNDRFRRKIAEQYGLKPGYLKRGRPRNHSTANHESD